MFWHLILCAVFVGATTARRLGIVKRSPEEHVPHEGRFDNADLDESGYPPLRGIEPALPPHLRYLEATPTELRFARKRENAGDLLRMDEDRSASARKLIEDNSTFDVTSGNITINEQSVSVTDSIESGNLDLNITQTLGTAVPETIITMKTITTKAAELSSMKTNKSSSFKRNISNRHPGRLLSNRQPVSRSTTIRYVNDTSNKRSEKTDEIPEKTKNEEKVAIGRNEDAFDPFQDHQVIEDKVSTQTSEKPSVVTDAQDDVVDGFMNRIQDHWVQFVQQMKHSVMDVWQTITSRIMNSLENFSVFTN